MAHGRSVQPGDPGYSKDCEKDSAPDPGRDRRHAENEYQGQSLAVPGQGNRLRGDATDPAASHRAIQGPSSTLTPGTARNFACELHSRFDYCASDDGGQALCKPKR